MAFSHILIKQHTAQQRAAQHSNIRAHFHPVARRSILRTVGHEPAEQHPNNRVEFSKQLRTHEFDKEEVARQRSHTFRGECAKLPICKLQMPSILDQVHENHRLTTVKSSAKNSSLMCLIKGMPFVDTTAKVNVGGKDVSCSALELSFSQSVITEGSGECSSMRDAYAQACCYIILENPCRLCTGGSAVSGNALVEYYDGSQKSCNDVANKLAMSTEAGSGTCSSTQNDFKDACCYSSCPICPQGFNLNWEVDVEYNKATISCGEFDQVIRGNAIEKGTQECASLQSSYSSACCYNYATATGYTAAADSAVTTVSITGQIITNLDTSSLTSTEKEQVENYFETALTKALESNGVLPQGSTVTITEIKEGVVSYGIDILEAEKESVDKISAEINSVLESSATLESITSEVVSQFSQTPLVEELSDLDVTFST